MQVVIAAALVACSTGAIAPSPSPSATTTPRPATSAPSPIPTQAASPTGTGTAPPSIAVHYVAIGASDTVGVGALDPERGSWPARIADLLPAGATYTNVGVSGSLVADAARVQLPAAIRAKPTLVSIWLAGNDLNAGVSPAEHAATLGRIVDELVAKTAARVFVGNVPDLRAVPLYADTDPEVLIAVVNAYNAGIAGVAASHGERVVLVDLFTGSAALMTDVTVAPDGFHPSDAGYVLIAERFVRAMREAGIPLRSS